MKFPHRQLSRRGHTLVELVTAMIASAILLAGLASVMYIAREVAYSPTASAQRINASEVVNRLSEELRFATFLFAHSTHALEFVVADRDGDGTAERIRYEWSGTPGDPLEKAINGGTPFTALDSVDDFQSALTVDAQSMGGATRSFASRAAILLQPTEATQSRIDASIPLENEPELLSAYWRADFDPTLPDPTILDLTNDGTFDWAMSSGSFNTGNVSGGVWNASGALESRPLNDFTDTTVVDVRCRNTSVGGNGAVVQINADRQGGQHAPILVQLQLQADGSQTLTLSGKSNDTTNVTLFLRKYLANDFVRFRLTVMPQTNVVNLEINGENQGSFVYPTYAPSANNGFVTFYTDTSTSQFDYVEVRVVED
jgi:hypothetical protein